MDIWVSIKELADLLSVSRSTVIRRLNFLKEHGKYNKVVLKHGHIRINYEAYIKEMQSLR